MSEGEDTIGSGRNERLGDFLRSRRQRIAAPTSGTGRVRRRTSGLRREEVASLAGISTEWYVKLEQGRGTSPSLATLDGIACALRLDEAERLHLLALAGRHEPASSCSSPVPDTLRAIVEGLAQPAYVTNRCWDVVVWNGAAVDLLGANFANMPEVDRNILVWMLLDGGARNLFGESWEDEARRMTSVFRATSDLYGDNPALQRRVVQLTEASPPFGRWWQQHDIGAPRSGSKRLHHPSRGELNVIFSTFQANDDPGLKLALYWIAP